jgi:ATP:ADP antiporter, AAA family
VTADARSPLERLLSRIVPVEPGEGRAVVLLFAKIFTLLFAYSLIKPVREMLILAQESAEVRSYVLALQAVALMVVIPLYTAALRRIFPHYHLVPWITVFLAANLFAFIALGRAGHAIGVPFFIWLGIFNVMIVAQFWAFAADLFSVQSGERLFVLIAIGASLGAWIGAEASKFMITLLGPYALMALTAALLLATVPLIPRARAAVPAAARPPAAAQPPRPDAIRGVLGGFRLVLGDPYLRLIAVFMVLLNCVNSTGEYLLAAIVREQALAVAGPGGAAEWIGAFYGSQNAWVNRLGLLVQVLLVARIFRLIGVGGATLVLPTLALVGYALLAWFPVFSAIRAVKIAENSLNYSLQNTARHALILPCDEEAKYAGKTTIDTFFWRLGDLLQAAVVWVGHAWLGASLGQFAALNLGLSAIWLLVALALGRRYTALTAPGAATGGAVAPAAAAAK